MQNQGKQESEEQMLANIKNLQNLEQNLYTDLSNTSSTSPDNLQQQNKIISDINNISSLRNSLYQNLISIYGDRTSRVNDSRNALSDQYVIIDVLQETLNSAKEKLDEIKDIKDAKMRMIQINTWYGKRYAAQTNVIKILIYTCIPILFIAILSNIGIIPNYIGGIIVIIILVIGLILIYNGINDINQRDNMDFDQYKWKFDASKVELPSNNKFKEEKINFKAGCFDEGCCADGTIWEKKAKKCIIKNNIYI